MAHASSRILVVDDLPDWRETLKGLLSDNGYVVEVAQSRSDAVTQLESQSFSLALVDVRLDEPDEGNTEGLDLAEEIRRRWPSTKIIIITGYGTQERLSRAMAPDAQGRKLADDYIPKTPSPEVLTTIQRVLAQ
jgi:ATP-dependent Lon protease